MLTRPLKDSEDAVDNSEFSVGQSCVQCDSRTFEKEEIGFSGCAVAGLTLNLASARTVQAVGKLGVMKSRISLNKSEVMGETVLRKPRFCIRSSIGGGAKRETKAGNGSCRVTKDGVAGTGHRYDA